MNIKSILARIKEAFGGQVHKPEVLNENFSTASPSIKRVGRGAYFTNNRKRTRGRNVQYVLMTNGRTKVIRHETM